MNEFIHTEKNSEQTGNQNYHLAIQISEKNFVACILDTVWNKYLAIANFNLKGDYTAETFAYIQEIISEQQLFHFQFNSVSAIVVSRKNCLVPSQYFDVTNEAQHLLFNQHIPNDWIIHHNLMLKTSAYNVFAMPKTLVEILHSTFGHVSFHHQATSLIENALHLKRSKTENNEMFVSIQGNCMDIGVIESTKLLFYNNFEIQNNNDVLYFVLLVCSELNLQTKQIEIELEGDIENKNELETLLRQYIANVRMKHLDNYFQFGTALNEIPQYFAANLINLYKCE